MHDDAHPITPRHGLNRLLFWLYEGYGKWPYVFRVGLLAFDLVTIAYFIITSFFTQPHPELWWVDVVIGSVIAADLFARQYVARRKIDFWEDMTNWADLIVVITIFAPLLFARYIPSLAFLRVLRAVRIVRAFTVLRRAKSISAYLAAHSSLLDRITNLVVFIFLMSALVWVFQHEVNDSIQNYVDALYFTVASLTTTGYGDIVMVGMTGRVLSVIIMVLGLTLFVRLLSALRFGGDRKIAYKCQSCGLKKHERDASHCKHCGTVVMIETDGGR